MPRVTQSRTLRSLVDSHKEFLDLVSNHGSGEIKMINHGNIIEILINNPAKRNSITGKMMNQLASITDSILQGSLSKENRNLVGIVLHGAGQEAFCAGADLSLVKDIVNTPEIGGMMSSFMTDTLNRIRQSNLVSVCCINGPALGGGAEISTTCDFRIMPMDEKVYIQFVHARIGASPGWGGARRLTNIVGRKHAIRICAGSARVQAGEAVRAGLVDDTVAAYGTEEAVMTAETPVTSSEEYYLRAGMALLQPFTAQKFAGSVRAIKQSIAAVEDLDTADAKAVEKAMFQDRWGGSDNKSAMPDLSKKK
jgi:ethylmalonyl-CoA/methylmalonyl-CoA decarboxylase